MRPELILITFGLWVLMAQKMTGWHWFSALHSTFPEPVRGVWDAWTECAFCGGFWLALLLKAATGLSTLPALAAVARPAPLATALDWTLDPLATAAAVHVLAVALTVLGEVLETFSRRRSEALADAIRRRRAEKSQGDG
jgi:hypothetical protein